jgi:L-alanine-DL-glutamate epimerase-like enolase superfamily enzyme
MAGLCQARLARKERARPDYGQLSYSAAIDNCLWDILGKAVGLPVYRILGAYKERVRAYASSQHLATVDAFVADVKHAQADGFTAYKIHPPGGPSSHDYKLDMEVIKAVRQTGGDKMALLYDPVGVLTRHEAMQVGRLLDELHYVSFEDALNTKDINGRTVEAFAEDVKHARSQGYTAYKIHPPWLPGNKVDYKVDMQVAQAVRKTGGDDRALLFDRVGAYSRLEAMKAGRVLDELNFLSFEDPLLTDDVEGLADLAKALDVPITIGEFILSPYDYAKYIRRGALDEVRFLVDKSRRHQRRHEGRRNGGVFRHAMSASQRGRPAGPCGPLPLRTGDAEQRVVRNDATSGHHGPAVLQGFAPHR